MKVYLTTEEQEVKAAWSEWLEGLANWKLFVTLTMRDKTNKYGQVYSPGLYQAKEMVEDFINMCKFYSSSEVNHVTVFELQKYREVLHSHSLVAGQGIEEGIDGLRRWSWEKYGFNRIVAFRPQVGAGGYIGKYLVKSNSDLSFSPGLGNTLS